MDSIRTPPEIHRQSFTLGDACGGIVQIKLRYIVPENATTPVWYISEVRNYFPAILLVALATIRLEGPIPNMGFSQNSQGSFDDVD